MLKAILVEGLVCLLTITSARAANCPTNPYNLTNGNNADASQVMANFNSVLNCANSNLAPVASPRFTGNVGIGTSAPAATLHVVGSIASYSASLPLVRLNATANPSDQKTSEWIDNGGLFVGRFVNDAYNIASDWMRVARNSGTYTAQSVTFPTGNIGIGLAAPTLTFQVNGTAGGSSAWQVVSDERLKRDIKPLVGALALVEQLKGVTYYWRQADQRSIGKAIELPQDQRQLGFVAQDVSKVLPEAVSYSPSGDGLYRLAEDNIIPILVEAIKEQQVEIDELRGTRLADAVPNRHHRWTKRR